MFTLLPVTLMLPLILTSPPTLTFPLTPNPPTTTIAPVDAVVLAVPLAATKLAPLNTAGDVLVL